jgi:hypothetical protein
VCHVVTFFWLASRRSGAPSNNSTAPTKGTRGFPSKISPKTPGFALSICTPFAYDSSRTCTRLCCFSSTLLLPRKVFFSVRNSPHFPAKEQASPFARASPYRTVMTTA